MIVHDDGLVRLVQGHVLDALRAVPAASVHTVVTSPPYWGLRDYGIPPQVWGGDPACAHKWGKALNIRAAKGNPGNKSGLEGTQTADHSKSAADLGAFCHCGAWRGSLGFEPTPELYVEHLVSVFAQVWRVLREDGTVWLNLGDCYASGAGNVGEHPGGGEQGARWKGEITRVRDDKRGYRGERLVNTSSGNVARRKTQGRGAHTAKNSGKAAPRLAALGPMTQPNRMPIAGLKPKDLVGIPWRVAFALQAWGWWLRSDIVWAKGLSFCPTYAGAVMPESIRDRPTRAHEYLFLLAKAERYFYDQDAVKEPLAPGSVLRILQDGFDAQRGGPKDYGTTGENQNRSARRSLEHLRDRALSMARPDREFKHDEQTRMGNRVFSDPESMTRIAATGRNTRSVWAINPQPFSGAHFATFPEDLVKPCVLVGTSARGACPECGAPWERLSVTTYRNDTTRSGRPAEGNHVKGGERQGVRTFASGVRTRRLDTTTGWWPPCACYDARYPAEFRQARRARKRAQRAAWGDWWRRARARPGRTTWPTVPCVVADPFAGAGTVLFVAKELGRHAIGVELSAGYCRLTIERLRQAVLPFGGSA